MLLAAVGMSDEMLYYTVQSGMMMKMKMMTRSKRDFRVQNVQSTYLLVGTSPLTEKGAARYSLVVTLPTSRGRFRLARGFCLLA